MKHKFKATSIFALVCFLVYLYGCQKEELEIEQPIPTKGIPFEVEVPQVESYFVAESSKGKVIDKLFKALGYTTRTGGNVTESYETGIGTILTDEILAVQDVFGTKYTFKLDHPEKDFYTFFNLVMVDKGEEVVVLLKKYIMTEEFANLYRSDQKTVDDFDGSVATTLLTNPCLCEFPNEGEPEIVYPGDYTPGGSGGGGTVAGSGPSGPVGGGTGGTTHCFLISFTMTHTITYTNGNSHTKTKRYTLDTCTGIITVNNKGSKTSKHGNNQTETYNENGCCSFGAIGIMDDNDSQDERCKKLKDLLDINKVNLKTAIDYLSNFLTSELENGKNFKRYPVSNQYPPSIASQPRASDNTDISYGEYFIGNIHTHPEGTVPMFSWADVYALIQLYEGALEGNKPDVFLSIVCPGISPVSPPRIYLLKVDDIVKLKSHLNQFVGNENDPDFSEKLKRMNWKIQQKFKNSNYQRAFLQYFYNSGLSLYKLSDDRTRWSKLNVNSTSSNSQVSTINPCN
jgi:hypothetical protein